MFVQLNFVDTVKFKFKLATFLYVLILFFMVTAVTQKVFVGWNSINMSLNLVLFLDLEV